MCMSGDLAVREHCVDGNISSKGEIKKDHPDIQLL